MYFSLFLIADGIKDELLEGYSEYDENNKLILTVRLAVVLAIILTIPLVHYPVSVVTNTIKLDHSNVNL